MVKKLLDVSLTKNVQKMSELSEGAQALINAIINESNDSTISTPGGKGAKAKFFNHAYDKDPSTQGGPQGSGVSSAIYYMPANRKEYDDYEVIDKAVGMLSGRRRLATRCENDKWSFYCTSHPKNEKIRSNTYVTFVVIDTTK